MAEFTLRGPSEGLGWRSGLARGVLRPWQVSDATALERAWLDSEIARWNPPPAGADFAMAERWIGGVDDRLTRNTALDLVIERSTTEAGATTEPAAVVGEVGVAGIDGQRRAGLVGYWVHAEARGLGIASAALTSFASWALSSGGFALLVAQCAEANLASQRVASAAGFTYARDDGDGQQLWVCRR